MASADTKSRIINIYRLLLAETDTEHYLTVNQIIERLEEKGISAYRKTVIADIEQLIESGIDVQTSWSPKDDDSEALLPPQASNT